MSSGPSESSKLSTKSRFRGVAERGIPEQVVDIEVRRPRGTPRSLSGSILSSQTDPPTSENVDFTMGILTFLKNNVFDPKMVLIAFWGSLGLLLGALGGILGALWGF